LAITKEKKQMLVEKYCDLLGNSEAAVFVKSRGLSVAEVTELRGKIREVGGSYSVVKNTLFRLALAQADLPVPDAITGPISVSFCPEDIAPVVKAIRDFAKKVDDREFEIVGGIVGRDLLDAHAAAALASLPTRDVLFAQLLAGINAPGTQLAGVVASGIRQVLYVLQARVDQLQEGEAAA
jgi:large subunit ribosomal protein L10